MLSPIESTFRTLAIAATVLCTLPCAYAQQGAGPVLPPPSLYDEPATPPAPATVPPAPVRLPTATQPAPVREPVAEPAPAPYVPPPESPRPAAAPVETPRPAAVPVESAPMATHSEPMEEYAEEEPWYRRLWPFGRSKSEPAPAAAPEPAAAAPVVVPPGRSSPQGEGRPPYAYDSPSKTIRTTVIGDCVKTGFWDTDRWGHGACPGTTPEPAPVAIAEPTPAPAPVIEPEPVQVQPLQPEPMEEPRALEPEPEPVAAPPPPPPPVVKTTTLAADTLFALNSFQLRPTAKAKLDEFAAELDQFDYDRIRITGHTDPTGSAQLNERLSRQRAQAVKSYLVSKGLPASKILSEGMGSSMPMVTDKDCSKLPRGQMVACFQPDRRVDIEVTGARIAHK
jgi:OOP family OmpA-OmpF porin